MNYVHTDLYHRISINTRAFDSHLTSVSSSKKCQPESIMIINVPDHNELEEVSLRLLFKAWAQIASIITEWDTFANERTAGHNLTSVDDEDERKPTADELEELEKDRKRYLKSAQNDLQSIYTLIQQSQEIGLKARICEVSPYLLLKKKTASAIDKDTSTFDFLDMPTHDAGELPDIHDTFYKQTLSKKFRNIYDSIRRNRNKIYHLGIYRNEIDPTALIETIINQYIELYPHRRWWDDRLSFATHRWTELIEYDDWTELTSIIQEMSRLEEHLSDEQFQFLMEHNRTIERLICYHCVSSASLEKFDLHCSDLPTAYRIEGKTQVRCVVCNEITEIAPEKCINPGCGGEFKSMHEYEMDRCMKCGSTLDDVKDTLQYDQHIKSYRDHVGLQALNDMLSGPRKY